MTPPFERVLIANRGEIAVRVVRACRDLGIESVAVYSDADADAVHTLMADHAEHIGPAQARESYLSVEKVVDAAVRSGAQAVHPGYGFLSENPDLPRACAAAGLVFVGPGPEAMAAVGDKVMARGAAERAGVPVVPGSPRVSSPQQALEWAESVGFPVLIKAAAGGGGRGIRRVDDPSELEAMVTAAIREAEAAFGDGGIFIEKCIVEPRHVEVQIVADQHGNVVHLGERECSLQRRRQKIVEESPAPGLPAGLRDSLGEAAKNLVRAVGYRGAGTVEFLVDPSDWSFYFIEVNARIQVEHGVTELTTGFDLVAEQLLVAAGEELSITQDDVRLSGTAIEFRINAEDPERNFFPSPGTLGSVVFPSGPGVRVDTGIASGKSIAPYYDSLIGKVMVWGADRDQALRRAERALDEISIEGVRTTTALHREIVSWETFRSGDFHTGSLEEFLSRRLVAAGQQ